jgi:hypothetical protein
MMLPRNVRPHNDSGYEFNPGSKLWPLEESLAPGGGGLCLLPRNEHPPLRSSLGVSTRYVLFRRMEGQTEGLRPKEQLHP